MTARRLYGPVVLGTLAAGGLAFFALGRTWATSRVRAEGLSADSVSATGADAHPLASALSLVIIASALAVLAASRRVRRGVGVLTVLVALLGIWIVMAGGESLDEALATAVEKSPSFTGTNFPDVVVHSSWSLVAVGAFLLAAVLGVMTVRLAPHWPTMSSRYDAPPVRPSVQESVDDGDMWKALDEGRDPTQ